MLREWSIRRGYNTAPKGHVLQSRRCPLVLSPWLRVQQQPWRIKRYPKAIMAHSKSLRLTPGRGDLDDYFGLDEASFSMQRRQECVDTLLPVIKGLDASPLGESDDKRSATSMRIALGQALVNLGQASQARKQISICVNINKICVHWCMQPTWKVCYN